jgi:hypothetical protein
MFDFLRTQGEALVNQVATRLMGDPRFARAVQTALKGKEWFDQAVAQALRTLNVPTRTEFKRALARIEALEQELAAARRPAAPRKPARRRPRTAKKKAAAAPAAE